MQPLVPADVDLRGLPFMPLDVNRLRDSQLAINASGDEFRAAVLLWCASWGQIPAASLPDDDRSLASYAGYGRDMKGWKKVRAGALRGWIKCDDGRWYHPVVAEKALEAWDARIEHRDAAESKNERQRRWRERCKSLCDQLRGLGIIPPKGASLETLERLLVDSQTDGMETSTETSTVDKGEIGKTGTGTGTGTEIGSPRKRGSRLPAGWQPTPDELRWARDARPDLDVTVEIERFRDYWIAKPGKDGVKLDWTATWRNWIRNARGIPGAAAPRPAPRRKQLGEGSSTDYGLGGAP